MDLIILFMVMTAGVVAPPTGCIVEKSSFLGERTKCEGAVTQLAELESALLPEDQKFGARNIVDLLLSRSGLFDYGQRGLENLRICPKHLASLGVDWPKSKKNRPTKKDTATGREALKCNIPAVEGFSSHRSVFANPGTFLTKKHSEALFTRKTTFVPLGTAMCSRHFSFMEHLVHLVNENRPQLEDGEHDPGHAVTGAQSSHDVGGHNLRQPQQVDYSQTPVRPGGWTTAGASPDVCTGSDNVLRSRASSIYIPPPNSPGDTADRSLSESLHEEENQCEKVKTGIRDIATAIGIPQSQVNFGENFAGLRPETKAKKANIGYKITGAIMSAFAPDQAAELMEMVFTRRTSLFWKKKLTGGFLQLVQEVAVAFPMINTRETRMLTLGFVASQLQFSELERHLPGLTPYAFKQARRYAKMIKSGFQQDPPSTQKIRYDKRKVQSFIAFITSSHVVTELPFGYVTLKKGHGVSIELPNLIRTSHNFRIIKQYENFLKVRNEYEDLKLSRSTLFRLLDACKALTRKSMRGIDYYTFEASESFDQLQEVIATIKGLDGDIDWANYTSTILREIKVFFKTDYKVHIQEQSPITDYSLAYALSDPSRNEFQKNAQTPEQSNRRCAYCTELSKTFKSIEDKITAVVWLDADQTDKKEAEFILEHAKTTIFDWQKHIVRTINQNLAKDHLMTNLKGNEIFLHMDWAMKFEPEKGREPSTEWFGKRGIPWHVTVAFGYKSDKKTYYQRNFVHVFEQLSQDSEAVLATLVDTLTRIKSELPGGHKTFYIRSDNAGCYHGAHTLVAIKDIARKVGVTIKRWDFSDPQSGKGPCDRMASIVKRHVRLYAAENQQCTTASEFLQCASSHGGIDGTTLIHAKFIPITGSGNKGSITGITQYYNFEFARSTIRGWYAYNIGSGIIIEHEARQPPLPTLEIKSGNTRGHAHSQPLTDNYAAQHHLWRKIRADDRRPPTTDQGAEQNEDTIDNVALDWTEGTHSVETTRVTATQAVDPDDPDGHEGLQRQLIFPCEEDGCTKVYQSYNNWLRHVTIGKHTKRTERKTLRDYAIDEYVHQVENSQLVQSYNNIFSAINEQRNEESNADWNNALPVGWALKTKKKVKRFTREQKEYLTQKFNEGAATQGTKYNPHDVAKNMRKLSQFSDKSQWLTWTQIASFWSRLSAERERVSGDSGAVGKKTVTAPAVQAEDDIDLEEIVDDLDANAIADHIQEAINQVLTEVFDTEPQSDAPGNEY